jgi:hypothetical protein
VQELISKASWFVNPDIRPYVYVRSENHIPTPGQRHHLDWFQGINPVYKNPLDLHDLEFAEQIYFLETSAFGPANLAMPRWVFYDCAVVPGFVAGFAHRTATLPPSLRKVLRQSPDLDWTPLSLFIIIPTMAKGEWVAHNLCSVNSLLPRDEQFYGLGFLSKAFGLWYANVETCVGMTQWASPARRLHSHYGPMEILTSYTPVHSHAETLTYRLRVNVNSWMLFFTREPDLEFLESYRPSGLTVDPKGRDSLIQLQKRLEIGEGPYFLSAAEIASQTLTAPLTIYTPKQNKG